MQHQGLLGTPCKLFQSDFLSAIKRWLGHGDRLLVFIDMNEHILTGTLPAAFQRLGLTEATHTTWNGLEPRTYVYSDGKHIDAVYHMPDLEIMHLLQLSFYKGVGDHRTVLLDVSTRSMIGKYERRVVTPKAR
jgi:hypothetical protein